MGYLCGIYGNELVRMFDPAIGDGEYSFHCPNCEVCGIPCDTEREAMAEYREVEYLLNELRKEC